MSRLLDMLDAAGLAVVEKCRTLFLNRDQVGGSVDRRFDPVVKAVLSLSLIGILPICRLGEQEEGGGGANYRLAAPKRCRLGLGLSLTDPAFGGMI